MANLEQSKKDAVRATGTFFCTSSAAHQWLLRKSCGEMQISWVPCLSPIYGVSKYEAFTAPKNYLFAPINWTFD